MVEHRSPKSVAGGSSPSWPAIFLKMKKIDRTRRNPKANASFADKVVTFPRRSGEFLRDVRAEIKKVTWPSMKEVVGNTIVVLISVIFFSIYLYISDVIFAWLIETIRVSFGG